MKLWATILLLFTITFGSAQSEYESSAAHPYGLKNPNAPAQLDDYKGLIGECDCISERANQDGSWGEGMPMKWRFKYIMNGMAVQDETLKDDGKHSGSIRQFNSDSLKWYVHYYTSVAATSTLSSWEGTKTQDGSLVFYKSQMAPNGTEGFSRLTFYDISETGYKWIGEFIDANETVVFSFWRISCTKPGQ